MSEQEKAVKHKDRGRQPSGRGMPAVPGLRAVGEEKLARTRGAPEDRSEETMEKVLRELQVHQIELEMQNEELKRAQVALEESRDKYLDLYDFAPVGYFTLTRAGQIAEVNLAGAAMLGLGRPQLLRRSLGGFVAPEDLNRWDQHLVSVLHSADKQTCELTLTLEDGSTFDARLDSIRLDRPAQEADSGGTGPMMRVTMSDISDLKRLQADLSDSETKFRRLFEAAQDGILILDADSGRITEVNPFLTDLLGSVREKLLGKTLWEIGAFKDVIANQDKFAELQQKQYVRYEDMPLETADGRRIDVEFVSNVYLVNQHKVIQCNIRDISDRKRAQGNLTDALAQLARSNKELESFAYTASHDLKGPLITITGFLGRLAMDSEKGNINGMHSDIARIGDATRKMDRLLRDVLELSRIGRTAVHLEDVSLTELAREVASLLAGSVIERGIRIEISPDLPTVHGERSRLTEMLMNLLDNAMKFMGEQPAPQVKIGVRRDGKEIVCYVQDNGIGIDPQHKDRIFGLFHQLDPSRGGTGIGLAVAKRVVETHGGRIWFESDGPGKGSTFCFTLAGRTEPVAQEEQENGRSLPKNLARVAG